MDWLERKPSWKYYNETTWVRALPFELQNKHYRQSIILYARSDKMHKCDFCGHNTTHRTSACFHKCEHQECQKLIDKHTYNSCPYNQKIYFEHIGEILNSICI